MTTEQTTVAVSALASGATWQEALDGALAKAGDGLANVDLLCVFASPAFAPHFRALLARLREATAAGLVVGCSGQALIGVRQELEGLPGVALLGLRLPGAVLRATHVFQADIEGCQTTADWHNLTGVHPDDVNGWLLLVDPFRLDSDLLLTGLSMAYPGVPLIGGLASGDTRVRATHVFLNESAATEGAVLLAIGGAYTVRTVVAQGAAPIGETWTITGVRRQWITEIGGRPAWDVLAETFHALPADLQERAQANLLVGLAMDEYKADYLRGDFLIRNLIGRDRENGALAVSDLPRVGQTVQFQVRDARAADEDLHEMLLAARRELGSTEPVAALLYSCNGRGVGLFDAPDHDAKAVADQLGPLPLAGFFCNGEIGPVGGKPYVHGFTASLALIVPACTP